MVSLKNELTVGGLGLGERGEAVMAKGKCIGRLGPKAGPGHGTSSTIFAVESTQLCAASSSS